MNPNPEMAKGVPHAPRDLEGKRQLGIDRLTQAFAADLLSLEDYEARVSRAQKAQGSEDIDAALAGLDSGGASESAREAAATSRAAGLPNRIDPRLSGPENVACVMGERQLMGDWLSGDHVSAFTIMGAVKLDLRDTALPPGRLKIDVFVLMGETKIIVPRGLPVRLNCFPFMGEAHAARDVARRIEPGLPHIEVSGFVMMGSLDVVAMD